MTNVTKKDRKYYGDLWKEIVTVKIENQAKAYGMITDDKEGADEAKAILLIFEPVGQVVRDGEAVIGYFRVVTESLGNENPVGPGTDDEADAGPKGGKTMEVSVSRKAHEHPAAHVRCFSAHGGEPRSQLPVP